MVIYNHNKPAKNISWNTIEERTNSRGTTETENNPEVVVRPKPSISGYTAHQTNESNEQESTPDYIVLMQEAMEEWASKPRDGYHVTDVCLCPRQKVFREIDRRPIDAKTVAIYSAGKAIHEAIQLLFRNNKRTFEIEKYVEYQDIQGSVDLYDRRRNIPLEFKTSRSRDMKEPKTFHLQQLKYYMSILNAAEGRMIYQCLLDFGETPFKTFRITMNAQEREDQRDKLVNEVNSLRIAMEASDPSLVRSIKEDSALNWLCKDCPYLKDCERIQDAAEVA